MTRRNTIYLLPVLLLLGSCAKLPFAKKTRIAKSAVAKPYQLLDSTETIDGNARQRNWWVCYSDRVNNFTQVSPGNDMPQKKLSFLEPLFVVKRSGDYVKVAAYDPSVNLKEAKGLVAKKQLKVSGWIRKEKLLLWSGALKDKYTSFAIKVVTNVAGEEMFRKPEKYFSNDSMLLFSTPDLTETQPSKIAIGQLAYVYKVSADKKSYLIGNAAIGTTDSIAKSILGWISVNAVSVWGTRTAFTYTGDIPLATARQKETGLFVSPQDSMPALSPDMMEERTTFENIFPLYHHSFADSGNIRTAYLGNVLDYSNNSILNVLGRPIAYNKYKEILQHLSRLNVVFVIDGGRNNQLYLPSVKSALQDLQLFFDTTAYFKTTRFGAVLYKQSKCSSDSSGDAKPLTAQYGEVIKFIQEKEKAPTCADENVYQPVSKALLSACDLLKDKKNETNIIIMVGTAGDDFGSINIASLSSAVSRVQARLMFFQTINRSADAYNDYILAAEKTVISSSQDIAELKKERLVNQDDVLPNTAYSLQAGDSGIYYLDYPSKSMTQGFVLYPKKGEVMPSGMLKKNFDSLLRQVIADNRHVIQSLRTYFRSNIGINNTTLLPQFNLFKNITNPVPTAFVKQVVNTENAFFIPAYAHAGTEATDSTMNYGVLLTEEEYDRTVLYFREIFKLSGAAKEKFNRQQAVRKYMHFLRTYAEEHGGKKSKKKVEKLSTAEALQLYTGFISTDTLTKGLTIGNLRSSSRISKEKLVAFFNRFEYAATAMINNKNMPGVRISCNGTFYYWADKKLMP